MKALKGMLLFIALVAFIVIVFHPVVASLILGFVAFKCWQVYKYT